MVVGLAVTAMSVVVYHQRITLCFADGMSFSFFPFPVFQKKCPGTDSETSLESTKKCVMYCNAWNRNIMSGKGNCLCVHMHTKHA